MRIFLLDFCLVFNFRHCLSFLSVHTFHNPCRPHSFLNSKRLKHLQFHLKITTSLSFLLNVHFVQGCNSFDEVMPIMTCTVIYTFLGEPGYSLLRSRLIPQGIAIHLIKELTSFNICFSIHTVGGD